jgi:hypothetical protein
LEACGGFSFLFELVTNSTVTIGLSLIRTPAKIVRDCSASLVFDGMERAGLLAQVQVEHLPDAIG